ncbi:MAG: hypothetical protein PVI57_18200 [Gemmatimonadota bacterium]|jgi:hypothetical protein
MTRRTTRLVLVAGVLLLSLHARNASGCTVRSTEARVPAVGVRVDVGEAGFLLETWVRGVVEVGLYLPLPTALPREGLRLSVAVGGGAPLLLLRVGPFQDGSASGAPDGSSAGPPT